MRIGLMAAVAVVGMAMPASATTTVHKVVVRKTITPDGKVRTVVSGDPAAKAIIAGCGERRFETSAEVMDQGHKRMTKIKLCAKPGEDDAMWLKSLRQASTTIKGTAELPEASRTKIVADLDAEIARVEAGATAKVAVPEANPPK
jgi:hypothetical protein